jgi:hypothetical protein
MHNGAPTHFSYSGSNFVEDCLHSAKDSFLTRSPHPPESYLFPPSPTLETSGKYGANFSSGRHRGTALASSVWLHLCPQHSGLLLARPSICALSGRTYVAMRDQHFEHLL